MVIIGAGCIGAAIARLLSQYKLSILWLEAADDVSQGATKGNSGIVHAGYDDTPGTNRAKYCWKGNQMFAKLDKELRFGYQRNGSLVVAFTKEEKKVLKELLNRGRTNGVQTLRILDQTELRKMEPHINPDAIAALFSPDAGNVIPYEFAIALAENAVDNGVELLLRRHVDVIQYDEVKDMFTVKVQYWEPSDYINASINRLGALRTVMLLAAVMIGGHLLLGRNGPGEIYAEGKYHKIALVVLLLSSRFGGLVIGTRMVSKNTPLQQLVQQADPPKGTGGKPVSVTDMLIGGSGSTSVQKGVRIQRQDFKCRYVINCAGGASDHIARLIGDNSFSIKPRLGDYILLNRNQGHYAKHTLFPTPDPVLGKGVLCQTTLWGNLILGPTARDMHSADMKDMPPESIQEYILSKSKKLVPSFDAKETIHAFCGARAKSTTGDWVIGPSEKNSHVIHVAGIDSPGLAGAPAIALDVVDFLEKEGLRMEKNPTFRPNRAPIITPKDGIKGLKMGPVGKFDSDGSNMEQMAQNVICKCERVTELEVVRAMRRSLPVDSSQGIRKRTRAGMGHCQGDPNNYNCEARVRAIIARENRVPISQIGGRPWPASSTLSQRWVDDEEKQKLEHRKMQNR